jgi:hypothetical protein
MPQQTKLLKSALPIHYQKNKTKTDAKPQIFKNKSDARIVCLLPGR